jgi:2-oxoglutarate dehydrogenase E1 component
LCRVEQISPFPYDELRAEGALYPNAELYWAQEEHKNMGAWAYVKPRFQTLFDYQRRVHYAGLCVYVNACIIHSWRRAGRAVSSSPATGSKYAHYQELKQMMAHAMGVKEMKDFH